MASTLALGMLGAAGLLLGELGTPAAQAEGLRSQGEVPIANATGGTVCTYQPVQSISAELQSLWGRSFYEAYDFDEFLREENGSWSPTVPAIHGSGSLEAGSRTESFVSGYSCVYVD